MLRSSFCCLKGISESAEMRLWQKGIPDWNTAVCWPDAVFSAKKWKNLLCEIEEAEFALKGGMADFFLNRLTGIHKARILADFKDSAGYLDIETSGLKKDSEISTIALRRNNETRVYVEGKDLAEFLENLNRCSVVVTYNGTSFDLPFLRRRFDIDLNLPHLDMRYVLEAIGCRGGQKKAEAILGICRNGVNCLDGEQAVKLWEGYCVSGDNRFLDQLVEYNAQDVLMLEKLASYAYRNSMSAYPFSKSCSLTIEKPQDMG